GEGGAGGGGGQAGRVDVVLDGEGDAPQRLCRIEARELLRRLARAPAVDERDEDAAIVRRLDRLEHALDDHGRVEPARVGGAEAWVTSATTSGRSTSMTALPTRRAAGPRPPCSSPRLARCAVLHPRARARQ